jgi:uncharacterized protein (TIGR02246 family)
LVFFDEEKIIEEKNNMVKKLLILLLAIGFTSTLYAQNTPTTSPVAPAPVKKKKAMGAGDEQGIKKAFNGLTQAWNGGDANGVAAYFTSDATLINPMGQQGQGHDGVLQVITGDLAGPLKGTQQSFSDFSFTFIMPNLALVDATATLTGMTNPDGTAAQPASFHFFGVLVNRGKGWQARAARIFAPLQPPSAATTPAGPATTPVSSGVSLTGSGK